MFKSIEVAGKTEILAEMEEVFIFEVEQETLELRSNSCCFGVDGWSLVASDAGLSEAFNLPARDEPFNRPPLSEDFAL